VSDHPALLELRRRQSWPLAKFEAWRDPDTGDAPQEDFVRSISTYRSVIFRAANRTGKTHVLGYTAPALALGWIDGAPHRPPCHIWASALDWDWGVGQVLWPAVEPWVPWTEVKRVEWARKNVLPKQLTFVNGSTLAFKSSEAGREKYQGKTLQYALVDEEHPADVVEELRIRLMKDGGVLLVAATPVRRERWLMDLERERGTKTVTAAAIQMARAGLMDMDALESMEAALPDRQRRVRLYGEYAALEGLVYPDFDRDVHVVHPRDGRLVTRGGVDRFEWPLPAEWRRFAAIDFGFANPTAVLVVARCPWTQDLIVERCYYQSGVRASVWARMLADALPPLERSMVADHDAMERAELQAGGVVTRPANKEVVPGLEAVERLLVPRPDGRPQLHLVVHERVQDAPRHPLTGRCDADRLAWEMEAYRYPEAKSETAAAPKDAPLKRDDHACLAPETRVLTAAGWRRIDEVGTQTRRWAEMVEVAWEGGSARCTPDHRWLTSRGWVRADALGCRDLLIHSDTYEPHHHLAHVSVVQREAVLPVRAVLLSSHRDEPGEGESWPGVPTPCGLGVDPRAALGWEGRARTPRERGHLGQQARESSDLQRIGAPIRAHDGYEARGCTEEARGACGSSREGVARLRGRAEVARGERAEGVGVKDGHGRDVRGLRVGVRDEAPGIQVLRERVQDAGVPTEDTRPGPRLVRVLSVRPGGSSSAWCAYVPVWHAFAVAGGAISHNCDALRYLVMDLERDGGGLVAAYARELELQRTEDLDGDDEDDDRPKRGMEW
jgi:phage terminase large subunit-like protein